MAEEDDECYTTVTVGDWDEQLNESQEKLYYVNTKTKEVTWEQPPVRQDSSKRIPLLITENFIVPLLFQSLDLASAARLSATCKLLWSAIPEGTSDQLLSEIMDVAMPGRVSSKPFCDFAGLSLSERPVKTYSLTECFDVMRAMWEVS